MDQLKLKQLLDYDNELGNLVWLKNVGGTARKGSIAGYLNAKGYRRIKLFGKEYTASHLVWLWHKGQLPQAELDHKNRCRDDNHIENLREATRSQNCINTSKPNRGVYASNNKFKAVIGRKYLGTYSTREEAASAYRQAAKEIYGDFYDDAQAPARLHNSIRGVY